VARAFCQFFWSPPPFIHLYWSTHLLQTLQSSTVDRVIQTDSDISITKYTTYILLWAEFPLTHFCCKGSRRNDQNINSVEIQKQSVAPSDIVPLVQPERYQEFLLGVTSLLCSINCTVCGLMSVYWHQATHPHYLTHIPLFYPHRVEHIYRGILNTPAL